MGVLMSIILYGIMAVGLAGMIWAVKNQKKNANAQPIAVISMIIVVISAVCVLNPFGCDPELDRIESNSLQFEKAKAKILADYVSTNFKGKKVILLIDSSMEKSGSRAAENISQFKGFLDGVEIAATEVLPIPDMDQPYDPNSKEPPPMPEEAINSKAMNALINKHKDADCIVNFIGLPNPPSKQGDMHRLACFKWKGKGVMVLLNEQGIYEARWYIQTGKIGAVAVANPDSTFDFMKDTAPKELKAAFDLRYTLLTPKNVNEFAKKNKGMFIE